MGRERLVTFYVSGAPVPQGSVVAHAARRKDGSHYGVVHYAVGTKLHAWRRAISVAARAEWGDELTFHPVRLEMMFHMARPLKHFIGLERTLRRQYADAVPDGTPDVDKLARAVMDALTDVVYGDDSQVTTLHAQKRYSDALPGLTVTIVAVP